VFRNLRHAPEKEHGVPTWPVAGLSLVLGFAVAEITGIRAVGGVVILCALAWCVPRWHEIGRETQLLVFYIGAFIASHLLGLLVTAWPAVAITAITVAAVTYRAENSV
jgi:hypothetical protein